MNVYNNLDEFPEDYKKLQMQIEKERLKREIEELEKEFSEVEVNE